jgi:hypothetical protein
MLGILALIFVAVFTGIQVSTNNNLLGNTDTLNQTINGLINITNALNQSISGNDTLIEAGVCKVFRRAPFANLNQLVGYKLYTNAIHSYVVFVAINISGVSNIGNDYYYTNCLNQQSALVNYKTYLEFAFQDCTTNLTGAVAFNTRLNEISFIGPYSISFPPSEQAKIIIYNNTDPLFVYYYNYCFPNQVGLVEALFDFRVAVTRDNVPGIVNITQPITLYLPWWFVPS